MATTWRQDDFRFRNDDGDQANATWKESAHVNHTAIVSGSTYKFRIRIAASEQGSTAGALTAYLYAQKNGAGGYTRVTAARADGLKVVDSTNLSDDGATTQQISAVTWVAGKVDDVDGTCTATASIARYSGTEHEFMLQIDAASVNNGDYFDIREYNSTSQFTTYTYTPRITISKPVELTGAGGIASAEAFGTPTVAEVIELTNAGNIAGSEAVGTPVAQAGLVLTGIASSETIGQAETKLAVTTTGIEGSETFGIPTVEAQLEPIELTNAGNIAGAEALGTPAMTLNLAIPAGIISAEISGLPILAVDIVVAAGVGSAEAFGNQVTSLVLAGTGIAGEETFGMPIVEAEGEEKNLYPVGISSLAAFGQPVLESLLSVVSIASMETFGVVVLGEGKPAWIPTPDVRKKIVIGETRTHKIPFERYKRVRPK